jgi:hypothetical protein
VFTNIVFITDSAIVIFTFSLSIREYLKGEKMNVSISAPKPHLELLIVGMEGGKKVDFSCAPGNQLLVHDICLNK